MSKIASYIAIFTLLLTCFKSNAQALKSSPFLALQIELATYVITDFQFANNSTVTSFSVAPTLFTPKSSFKSQTPKYNRQLVSSYNCNNYYEDLSVFCKVEYKLEKTFKFPIKIRLGEVHYTEQLEGKKGYAPQ